MPTEKLYRIWKEQLIDFWLQFTAHTRFVYSNDSTNSEGECPVF